MKDSELKTLEMRCLFHDQPLTLTDQVYRGDAKGIRYEVYRFKGVCGCRVTFERGQGSTDDKTEKQVQAGLNALQLAQIELRKEIIDGRS